MKNKIIVPMIAAAMAAVLFSGGCGKKEAAETAAQADETETSAGTAASSGDASGDTAGTEDSNADVSAAEEEAAAIDAAVEELEAVTRPDSLGTVKLGSYEGIELTAAAPVIITEEDADQYIEQYVLPSYQESTDEPIENGDTVTIDYVGKKDDVAFDGGAASGYDLVIGSDSFIDGFEDGLIGYRKGDSVSLELTFPENYGSSELAGEDVVFDVTIQDVKRNPELDDALAKEIDADAESAAAYRASVREELQKEQEYRERQSLAYSAISAVLENSEVVPSDDAVDWKVADLIAHYYGPMMEQYYGFTVGQMLALQGETLEEFQEELRSVAEETIGQSLVMNEVAAQQNLVPTEEDMETFAADNGTTLEALRSSGTVTEDEIIEAAAQNMAADYVIEHAKITYGSTD